LRGDPLPVGRRLRFGDRRNIDVGVPVLVQVAGRRALVDLDRAVGEEAHVRLVLVAAHQRLAPRFDHELERVVVVEHPRADPGRRGVDIGPVVGVALVGEGGRW
jgi:hypothetical protein